MGGGGDAVELHGQLCGISVLYSLVQQQKSENSVGGQQKRVCSPGGVTMMPRPKRNALGDVTNNVCVAMATCLYGTIRSYERPSIKYVNSAHLFES